MKRWSLLPLVALMAASCATKKVELKMNVEVLSEPAGAEVRYRGKPIGATPKALAIESYDDLGSITALRPELDVLEKRVRILSPDHLEIVFKLGKEASPIAKRLGLTRVLIFEYSEKVTFEISKYDLNPAGLPILKKQAEILKVYFPNAQVHVCGFTDATGTDEINDRLSLQRAQAVQEFLVSQGVAQARLLVQGFGKEFETASNETPEGRARNRRTEVILPQ